MDSRTLVETDIKLGEEAATALLGDTSLHVRAVMWWLDDARHEWRLLVATPVYEWKGAQATYLKARKLLEKASLLGRLPLERVWIVDDSHDIPKVLGKFWGGSQHVQMTNLNIGGVLIDGVYIYHLSKPSARPRKKKA